MRVWNRVRSWLRAVTRRSRMEREMDAELRFHVEAFAEDLVRSGVKRAEARRCGRIEFGGIERAKEECREARGVTFIDSLIQDLRFGLRTLRNSPGFTAVAVLTLAMGIGVTARVFSAQGAEDKLGVVVNETFVHQFLSGIDPVGTHIRLGEDSAQWVEILGVVKDTMHGRPGEPAPPIVFRLLTEPYPGSLSFLVRTAEGSTAIRAALSSEARALNPQMVFSLSTLQEITRNAMWQADVGALLASALGALAIGLATVGLFGVVAYNVRQRTREVAIRMAFGAASAQVIRLVLAQALRPVMTGAVLGLIGALVLSRTLTAFLFGLSPWDPVAFASCAVLLAVVTLLAAYIPSRRAMKVDPMAALKYE